MSEKAPRKIYITEKDFIKNLYNVVPQGLWQDELYLERKSRAVRLDSHHSRFVWKSHGCTRKKNAALCCTSS